MFIVCDKCRQFDSTGYLMSHNISQVGGLNEQQCPRPGYEKLLAVSEIFKTIPIKDLQIFSIRPLS